MNKQPANFRYLMTKLSERMIDFLNDELAIETTSITFFLNPVHYVELNYLTSLINIEGDIKMFFAFSYDERLFSEIFNRYVAELHITADEQHEALIDSAGDIINIIVGNTLAMINDSKKKITMSPPIVITEAKHIGRPRNALFYSANLLTEYGKLDMYLVGPSEQFDDKLNYVGCDDD